MVAYARSSSINHLVKKNAQISHLLLECLESRAKLDSVGNYSGFYIPGRPEAKLKQNHAKAG